MPLPLLWPATSLACTVVVQPTRLAGAVAMSFVAEGNDIVCAIVLPDKGGSNDDPSVLLIAPAVQNQNASAPACNGVLAFCHGMQMVLQKVGACANVGNLGGIGCTTCNGDPSRRPSRTNVTSVRVGPRD